MIGEKFKVEFLEEVMDFLDGLDEKVRSKILFNIDKAKVKNDSSLFKKTEFRHLGVPYPFQQKTIPTFCILEQIPKECHGSGSDPRNSEKNTEDPKERN